MLARAVSKSIANHTLFIFFFKPEVRSGKQQYVS